MNRKGFTLIELLIVIAILGILAAAVLVAVDPVGRIQESRDARRWSESNAILNAVLNKQVDDRAYYYGTTSAPVYEDSWQIIVSDDAGIDCANAADRPGCDQNMFVDGKECVANLSSMVPDHIAEIPVDPRGFGTDGPCVSGCMFNGALDLGLKNSGYYIHRTPDQRIEIGACAPEGDSPISVTR
jgi:prepilin-type N-terminal cleavage/methylation domain-containing protein